MDSQNFLEGCEVSCKAELVFLILHCREGMGWLAMRKTSEWTSGLVAVVVRGLRRSNQEAVSYRPGERAGGYSGLLF